jgi:hypothetical protein
LKLEMDSGQQTRMFYFGTPKSQGGDWQGVSKASWDYLPQAVTDTLAFNRGATHQRRIVESRHDEFSSRLPAQERRAVQRERGSDRVF